MPGKAPPKSPFDAAVAMLSRRPYSVAELRRALERKFPGSSDIPGAIARLRELGYLNDAKFAEAYASSLARVRAFGRHRIRRELKNKWVDYRVIDKALKNALASVDERELLERTLDRKIRTLRKPVTRAKLASLCQGLIRRGFRADDIMKAIRAREELNPLSCEVDLEETEEER
ncbi:MAG TPA: regulatory protein RecX [Terriglobia bacterium]|nr:regulatory protein RecX [Terriglobia bacterium]